MATLLAAEVHLGYSGVRAWLPYLPMLPLASVVLMWRGRHRVTLRGDELQVGPAHRSVHRLRQVRVIYPNATRRALDPNPAPYRQPQTAGRARGLCSGRAIPADHPSVALFSQPAAVMDKEAARTGELVGLFG
ncbi:MAG: DUF3093 family protein [Pseudonocardiales bacterium]|nr:DUF3093 family protein [Pseudonocardiales bacterium]